MRKASGTIDWAALERLSDGIAADMNKEVIGIYQGLTPGSSTPRKIRQLETGFINLLPGTLERMLEGLNGTDGASGLFPCRVRLAVAHCRGLTLADSDPITAHRPTAKQPNRIGQVSRIQADPNLVPDVLSDVKHCCDQRVFINAFHQVYYALYQKLVGNSYSLSRFVLERAARKAAIEIHLDTDGNDCDGHALYLNRAEINAIAPDDFVHELENKAKGIYQSLNIVGAEAGQELRDRMDTHIAACIRDDRSIPELQKKLAALCNDNLHIGDKIQKYLSSRLSIDVRPTDWLAPSQALEIVQALSFYRNLGGHHFYAFPTSSAPLVQPRQWALPPSSLVLMPEEPISAEIRLLLSHLAHSIFDPKDSLTMSLLYQETSSMRLFKGGGHQFRKLLDAHEARITKFSQHDAAWIGAFKQYTYQSMRLVQKLDRIENLLKPESVSLGQVIEYAGYFADVKRSNVTIDISRLTVDEIMGDKWLLWLLFYNLIDNATNKLADRTDGTIEIESRTDGDCVIVRIADNGPGLTRKDAFSYYHQYDAEGQEIDGLGRFITLWIAEAHNGTLRLSDAPGESKDDRVPAIFELRLPQNCINGGNTTDGASC